MFAASVKTYLINFRLISSKDRELEDTAWMHDLKFWWEHGNYGRRDVVEISDIITRNVFSKYVGRLVRHYSMCGQLHVATRFGALWINTLEFYNMLKGINLALDGKQKCYIWGLTPFLYINGYLTCWDWKLKSLVRCLTLPVFSIHIRNMIFLLRPHWWGLKGTLQMNKLECHKDDSVMNRVNEPKTSVWLSHGQILEINQCSRHPGMKWTLYFA